MHLCPPSWEDAAAGILALQRTLIAALHGGDRKARLEACLARQIDLLVGTPAQNWYNHSPAAQAPYARLFAHLVERANSINKRDGPVCAILFLVSNAPSHLDTISCQLIAGRFVQECYTRQKINSHLVSLAGHMLVASLLKISCLSMTRDSARGSARSQKFSAISGQHDKHCKPAQPGHWASALPEPPCKCAIWQSYTALVVKGRVCVSLY